MPTPAYPDDIDTTAPAGSDSPAQFSTDLQTQLRGLRDAALTGRLKGFAYSQTQGTGPDAARPQYHTWLNSTLSLGFRMKIVYGGTGNWQLTSIEWEWSNDNGASWASMGTASANTYDGSNNLTASTNASSLVQLIAQLWTKATKVVSDLASHLAGTGTAVHGLGSMSTQGASAVAITGGTINGTTLGATTPAAVDATRVREAWADLGSIAAAGTATCDLSAYAGFSMQPHATTSNTMTIAFTNPPANNKVQSWYLEIINGQRSADAKITWPANVKWIGGSGSRPADTTLELSGRNIFVVYVRDGGARYEIQHVGKGG